MRGKGGRWEGWLRRETLDALARMDPTPPQSRVLRAFAALCGSEGEDWKSFCADAESAWIAVEAVRTAMAEGWWRPNGTVRAAKLLSEAELGLNGDNGPIDELRAFVAGLVCEAQALASLQAKARRGSIAATALDKSRLLPAKAGFSATSWPSLENQARLSAGLRASLCLGAARRKSVANSLRSSIAREKLRAAPSREADSLHAVERPHQPDSLECLGFDPKSHSPLVDERDSSFLDKTVNAEEENQLVNSRPEVVVPEPIIAVEEQSMLESNLHPSADCEPSEVQHPAEEDESILQAKSNFKQSPLPIQKEFHSLMPDEKEAPNSPPENLLGQTVRRGNEPRPSQNDGIGVLSSKHSSVEAEEPSPDLQQSVHASPSTKEPSRNNVKAPPARREPTHPTIPSFRAVDPPAPVARRTRPAAAKSRPPLTAQPLSANRSMALHTQSVVKAYIHNPVVRQRLGAPTHAVNAQKKEINRLRIEAGHYRFIIEREAAQKARNDLPAPVSPHDLRLQAAAVRRDQAESLRNERTQLQGEVEYFKGLLQRRL